MHSVDHIILKTELNELYAFSWLQSLYKCVNIFLGVVDI
jgi:hypothetical protein